MRVKLSLAGALKQQNAMSQFRSQLNEKRLVYSELTNSADDSGSKGSDGVTSEQAYVEGLAHHMIYAYHACQQKPRRPLATALLFN